MLRPVPGATPREISISGYLFPWRDGGPVLVELDGCNDWFLPVFSTENALKATMATLSVAYESIKVIDDGKEFLDGIRQSRLPKRLRIAANLSINGLHSRFNEIIL